MKLFHSKNKITVFFRKRILSIYICTFVISIRIIAATSDSTICVGGGWWVNIDTSAFPCRLFIVVGIVLNPHDISCLVYSWQLRRQNPYTSIIKITLSRSWNCCRRSLWWINNKKTMVETEYGNRYMYIHACTHVGLTHTLFPRLRCHSISKSIVDIRFYVPDFRFMTFASYIGILALHCVED